MVSTTSECITCSDRFNKAHCRILLVAVLYRGMLNHLVIVNSGYGAEYGPLKCLSNEPPQNRIWSQGTASSQNGWLSKDFYQVNGFAIGSAFVTPTCNGNTVVAPTSGNGVFQHEMGHGFGLPDLYDQDKNAPKLNLLGGIGRFDIMCNAHGWSLDTFISGQMSPYTRIYNTSWVDPILIVEDGYYAIQPSEISGQIYKITHNFPAGEYLLIENRQPIKWDSDWTASGIIIYHIDEAKPNQKTRGWPGSPGWPANHFRVSVIPSDGLYEIEQGINMGDQGDFWVNGQVLGPGPKFPNTDSIQHGIQKATGVTISVLSDSGFIMTFQVQGIGGSRTKRVGSVGGTGRQGQGQSDPNTTGNVLVWILSMLGGVAAMLGIVIILL